jgi:hypothetical protein
MIIVRHNTLDYKELNERLVAGRLTLVKPLSRLLLMLLFFANGFSSNALANLQLTLNAGSELFSASYVHLGPGTYFVIPIRGAWSTGVKNEDCAPNNFNCLNGWNPGFAFSSSSSLFTQVGWSLWATPQLAFEHRVGTTITLSTAEVFKFFLNDCSGCFGNNRGSLALEIQDLTQDPKQDPAPVPEPSTMFLLAFVLGTIAVALGRKTNRERLFKGGFDASRFT